MPGSLFYLSDTNCFINRRNHGKCVFLFKNDTLETYIMELARSNCNYNEFTISDVNGAKYWKLKMKTVELGDFQSGMCCFEMYLKKLIYKI